MEKRPVFTITVTGLENGEWQGTAHFPDSGEQHPFQSLLELVRLVESHGDSRNRKWEAPQT